MSIRICLLLACISKGNEWADCMSPSGEELVLRSAISTSADRYPPKRKSDIQTEIPKSEGPRFQSGWLVVLFLKLARYAWKLCRVLSFRPSRLY